MAGERYLTQDHDLIQDWAEERGGTPVKVEGTGSGGDPGIIRLDFPDYGGGDALEEIPWDEWFSKFDENELVFLYQETTAEGERSNFNKILNAETAVEAGSSADWA